MERLITVAKAQGGLTEQEDALGAFIAGIGKSGAAKAMEISFALRDSGISSEFDTLGRSLKAQMKYAGKLGAAYVAILGDDEIAKGVASVKEMATGTQVDVPIDSIVAHIKGKA
jgi:histidyl-tRNA synthetase